MKCFIQALLAVAVFGIMIEFSDKGTHPQDKHSWSWGFRRWVAGPWAEPHKFCNFVHLRPSQMQFDRSWGDNFAWSWYFKLRSFAHCESLTVNFPATQLKSRLPYLRTLRIFKEKTISHYVNAKNWKDFFQGVLPSPNSFHRQSERQIFVLWKPNSTNTTTARLHNHAVFSNGMKQQQTGHVFAKLTDYVYCNKIFCSLFNLQLGCQMKTPFKYIHVFTTKICSAMICNPSKFQQIEISKWQTDDCTNR